MILTGIKIFDEVKAGNIKIFPFDKSNINPNSYNYKLDPLLKHINISETGEKKVKNILIPEGGLILKKGEVYLGTTYEKIGSDKYSMRLIGRSSTGRLGLFLQISADLGHVGSYHKWTLEILPLQDIIVYPLMRIGQVSFWLNEGSIDLYQGFFGEFNIPKESW
ncbi:hypothetical protein ACGYLS_19895 [Bacillus subtilis]